MERLVLVRTKRDPETKTTWRMTDFSVTEQKFQRGEMEAGRVEAGRGELAIWDELWKERRRAIDFIILEAKCWRVNREREIGVWEEDDIRII